MEMAIFAFFAWCKNGLLALFFLIVVVYTLEMLLHSTYTVTSDGKLVIYKGRFIKSVVLSLTEIDHVENNHYSFNFGIHTGSYVLIVMKNGKEIGVRPENEAEFISYLEYKQTHIAQHINDNDED